MVFSGNKDTQNIISDTPNQPLITVKKIGALYMILLNIFLKLKNIIDWLVTPNVVGHVEKENDELRNLNFQLRHHVNDLKASMCPLKESIIL